jgi:microcystin-dependent protein
MPRVYDSASYQAVPIGGVIPIGFGTVPFGFLLCTGSGYSNVIYPELFAVIGFTYGGTSPTFLVPNLIGRVPMGAGGPANFVEGGSPVGITLGQQRGWGDFPLQPSQTPQHQHMEAGGGGTGGFGRGNSGINVGSQTYGGGWGPDLRPYNSTPVFLYPGTDAVTYVSTQAQANYQPSLGFNWAIRYV